MGIDPLKLETVLEVAWKKFDFITQAEFKQLRLELYHLRCCKEAQDKEDERLRSEVSQVNFGCMDRKHDNKCLCPDCRYEG